MPRNTDPRRILNRRSLPPRPTYADAETIAAEAVAVTGAARGLSRPARLVEREAPYLIDELKRVALVTATCVGLLVLLTVVDRMR